MRIATLIAILAFFGAAAYAGSEQKFEPDMVCASIWKPVCASNGSDPKTFPNSCVAEQSGYATVSRGECGATTGRMLPICGEGAECGDDPTLSNGRSVRWKQPS